MPSLPPRDTPASSDAGPADSGATGPVPKEPRLPATTAGEAHRAGGSPAAAGSGAAAGSSSTRERLLDAAESLFAEHGYPSTSLRQITGAAGANLAAVHYHFGSKLSLFREVLHRRLGPINEERVARLKRAIANAPDGQPSLDAVLRALLAPALELKNGDQGQLVGRLIGRSIAADGDHWRSLRREFGEVFEHFLPVLKERCPQLTPADLMWRMHFIGGCLGTLLQGERKLVEMSDGLCNPRDPSAALDQLVAFAHAGLTAPGTGGPNAPTQPCSPPNAS